MGRRFAIRTIRDGAVTIHGEAFRPDTPWPPRLNGLRAAFGLYHAGRKWDRRFVSLWGTERAYRHDGADWPGPFCEDGRFKWEWWSADPSRLADKLQATQKEAE